MIRLSVLYPRTEGARFDWAYYLGKHVPLVNARLGAALRGVSIEQGLGGDGPGKPPAFVACAHLTFDSVAAMEAAFLPHEAEIVADIAKYTSIAPVIQISEVKVSA